MDAQIARSTDEWEAHVGAQVRRARLNDDLDQRSLAERANISIGALRNLENGRGSTLRTVIRVARALDRADWLDAFEPEPALSPLQTFRDLHGLDAPRRASRRRPEKRD